MTTSASGKITASLLPYLQSGGGHGFRFSLSPGGNAQEDGAYPFALLDDSAPYSRVIEATIATDAGSLLKKVTLQVQKDHYTPDCESLRHVSNLDIEAGWQRAFAGPGRKDQILLSSQTDQRGRLVKQASLFYCREKDVYFHPPCPSCGLPLTLCTDETYLAESGLSPYVGSSKRYLYCSACCAAGSQEVYLYKRDPGDPAKIRDFLGLVDRFGMIDEHLEASGPFPCASCLELGNCYGPGKLARSRVVPFSFYPFYLLAREAQPLHSMEYPPLVVGNTQQELQELLDPSQEAPRKETLLQETTRQDAPRKEAPQPEAPQPEARYLEAPRAVAGEVATPSCDALVKEVVAELIRSCRAELQQRPVSPAPLQAEVDEDEDEVATVIISALPQAPSQARPQAPPRFAPDVDDMITETVVLSSHPPTRPAPQPPPPRDEADAMMETVVLNAPRPTQQAEPAQVPERDALGETMVLNAPRAAQHWQQSPRAETPAPAPPQQQQQHAPPGLPLNEADELGETVVITPHRDKPRR